MGLLGWNVNLAEAAGLAGWTLSSPILATAVLVQIKRWQHTLPLMYPVKLFQISPVGRNGRGRWFWGNALCGLLASPGILPNAGHTFWQLCSSSVGPARIWIRICQMVNAYQEEFKTCLQISLVFRKCAHRFYCAWSDCGLSSSPGHSITSCSAWRWLLPPLHYV